MEIPYFEFKTPVCSNGQYYTGYKIALTTKDPVIVSDDGIIYSISESNGYKYLLLKNIVTKKCDRLPLGPLLLSTFKTLPPIYEVEYIDLNSLNVSLSNLRWAPVIKADAHSFYIVDASSVSIQTRPLIDSNGLQLLDYSISVFPDGECQIHKVSESKVIKSFIEDDKNVYVHLVDEVEKKYLLSELILSSFVSKRPEYVCDYINGKVDDNNISNLRWVTRRSKTFKRNRSFFSISKDSDFTYKKDEMWKEIDKTGVYLSSSGREANRTHDGFYLKKPKNPRSSGNIRMMNPVTEKLVDVYTLVAEMFFSPKPSASPAYNVVRKPGSPRGSNELKDLCVIDLNIPLTYTYVKNGVTHKRIPEKVLLSQTRIRKKVLWASSNDDLLKYGVARENSNQVPVEINYNGCFEVKDDNDFNNLFKNFKISDDKTIIKEDEENKDEDVVESSDSECMQKKPKYDEVLDLDNTDTINQLQDLEHRTILKNINKFKRQHKSFRIKSKVHREYVKKGSLEEEKKRAHSI